MNNSTISSLATPLRQGDPELPAQRLVSTQGGRDGHRDEGPAAIVQAPAAPGVAERVLGGEPPEVGTRGGFTGPQREDQGLAEQSPGGIESVLVTGSGHADLAFFMPSWSREERDENGERTGICPPPLRPKPAARQHARLSALFVISQEAAASIAPGVHAYRGLHELR